MSYWEAIASVLDLAGSAWEVDYSDEADERFVREVCRILVEAGIVREVDFSGIQTVREAKKGAEADNGD